jgi:hypothetical protein
MFLSGLAVVQRQGGLDLVQIATGRSVFVGTRTSIGMAGCAGACEPTRDWAERKVWLTSLGHCTGRSMGVSVQVEYVYSVQEVRSVNAIWEAMLMWRTFEFVACFPLSV